MSNSEEMIAMTTVAFFNYLADAYTEGVKHGSEKILDDVFYHEKTDPDKFVEENAVYFKDLFTEFVKNKLLANKHRYE